MLLEYNGYTRTILKQLTPEIAWIEIEFAPNTEKLLAQSTY